VIGWLKHAFAVEPSGPAEPTSLQRKAVEQVCVEIVRRQLITPALLILETSRPLNFIGAQVMHFFAPLVSVLTDSQGHRHFAEFLERRGSIDYIFRRIEQLESTALSQQRGSGIDGGE